MQPSNWGLSGLDLLDNCQDLQIWQAVAVQVQHPQSQQTHIPAPAKTTRNKLQLQISASTLQISAKNVSSTQEGGNMCVADTFGGFT